MEHAHPTRTALIGLRRRIEVTRRGLELLRGKRDALIREFLAAMKQAVRGYETIDRSMRDAMDRLVVAWGLDGRSALLAEALRRREPVSVDVTERNIWGVRFPEVQVHRPRRERDDEPGARLGAPVHVEVAAGAFERALDVILNELSAQVRLKRLGAEIKRTTRRINALNEVVLPSLSRQVREIRLALEERDREEVFRTKRFRTREVEP